ncbi:MAG: hypothetical protein ACRC1T_10625 [Clostridium chrysemydis]|uniref:hypothetical protein n=1 Tax=Clostridium chrysemydis TaxID=2665504 RepID=UPI003F2EC84B
MNEGQKKFHDFIIQNVSLENKEKAEELLKESFKKQDEGTFNAEYMQSFMPRMLCLIKPESLELVKNIMINHKG